LKYAICLNERIEPYPNARGNCICCGADMIAKCGNVKIHHWAHKNKQHCDHWWENETQWHRDWKNNFPLEWQEVINISENSEKHISDVKTPAGLTIEFQHSAICEKEKNAREKFYKQLIWIINGRRLKTDYEKFNSRPNLFPWKSWQYPEKHRINLPVKAFPSYKSWINRSVPVLFDGRLVDVDGYSTHQHLLCGLHKKNCFTIEKSELLNLLNSSGNFPVESFLDI
jgi:competence protein CoiA